MKRLRIVAISVAAFVVGGILGTGASALAALPHQDDLGTTPYATNSFGQTYGSNIESTSPEQDPDLVLVIGDHGHEGYVRSSELYELAPTSPAEAVRDQSQAGEVVAELTVYERDGRTAIDTFTIVASGGN